MRMRMFGLELICAALCSSFPLTGQVTSGDALNQVALSKLVFPETFTTVQPTVFHLHGHDALCYELYIVNMSDIPAELRRVQVLGADGATVLQDKTGKNLAAALKDFTRKQPAAQNPGVFGAGEQIVFYGWVDMPAGSAAPASIRHAITMRQKDGEDLEIVTREIAVKQVALEIQSPLRGSNWLAANGPSNTSGHRRTFFPLGGNSEVPQRYAIDWVMVDKSGRTFSGDEHKNESYFCYGQKVHAVADGVVTEVKDGIPQNIPGGKSRAVPITLETIGGNHVIVDLGGGIYAFYAHLQPRSLLVKLGDHVKQGQVLALLGNSGNSTQPHLHFHLIDHNSPLGGEGLPFSYQSYQLLGQKTLDHDAAKLNWLAGPQTVKLEIPAENDIVRFAAEDK
jgi:murein DD-endopeptidase